MSNWKRLLLKCEQAVSEWWKAASFFHLFPCFFMLILHFLFFFLSFFLLVTEKDKKTCFNAETNDFHQRTVWWTLVCWSKYTTYAKWSIHVLRKTNFVGKKCGTLTWLDKKLFFLLISHLRLSQRINDPVVRWHKPFFVVTLYQQQPNSSYTHLKLIRNTGPPPRPARFSPWFTYRLVWGWGPLT